MQDILSAHAERVQAANDQFSARAKSAREQADAQARVAVSAFGARLVEIASDVETARVALSDALVAIFAHAEEELRAAFDDNVAAIALSTGSAQQEFEARAAFLATGRLPTDHPLPRAATDLVFRESGPPEAELIVLARKASPSGEEPRPELTAAE